MLGCHEKRNEKDYYRKCRAMNQQEIEKLYHLPISELRKTCCDDDEMFATVLSLGINMGIRIGGNQRDLSINRMFKGYNEVSIEN